LLLLLLLLLMLSVPVGAYAVEGVGPSVAGSHLDI